MHATQKLTNIIAGRTITAAMSDAGLLTLEFDDGSAMKIKLSKQGIAVPTGGKVGKVRQEGTKLLLDLKGGGTVTILMAEATSSVTLCDHTSKLEYAN